MFPAPNCPQGSLSEQGRYLCQEVRRPQDALPQLKRPAGQFVKRPADAYRSLYWIGPTEASFLHPAQLLRALLAVYLPTRGARHAWIRWGH